MNADELWYDGSAHARAARLFVAPLGWLYRSVVAARNALYDGGMLRSHDATIPVVSIGNLTVGGTGKTPFSAFIVRELLAMGHRPAVVMRGYGDDERHLHARMNPGVPVVTGADRVAGIQAAVKAGADVAVLDDGFQHRRARRNLDIVLVSAEQWAKNRKMLPAGPFREPVGSLRRANIIVVTQKSASNTEVRSVMRAMIDESHPHPIVVAFLVPTALVSATGNRSLPLDALRGAQVLCVAGVADPGSFFAQLRQLGALVTERRFADHHAYSAVEAEALSSESGGHKYVVTTEKDAVKLSALWPANGPELWYLSQAVRLTEGKSLVAAALAKLFKRATSIAG